MTVATLLFILFASLFKITRLRSGGGQVAQQMGGIRVDSDTRDPLKRRLVNVVEEIALASGVPVPEIYVLDRESGINAFAAGYSPSDAAVAVTRGTLEKLNRAELQGVIAHEFSHILNGDMRINIRLMGTLFGILVLAVIGRRIIIHSRFMGRSSRSKEGGVVILAAVTLIVALAWWRVGWRFALFAVAVIALGRWRGVGALAGLAVSSFVIVVFALPAILDGRDAVLIAVVAAGGTWLLMKRTTLGFGLQAVGENPVAARYAGFSVTRVILFKRNLEKVCRDRDELVDQIQITVRHEVGHHLGLSPLIVFLSLLFWGWMWGYIGMLLSVPLTMIIKILLENTDDLRWVAVMLDTKRGAARRLAAAEAAES